MITAIHIKRYWIKLIIGTGLIFGRFVCEGQLKANFTATPLSGWRPLTVNFQDMSAGNPATWQWNLGNGSFSNSQSPSTSYFTPGIYTVSLKVSNATGKDSITKTSFITVYSSPVV